MEQRLQNKIRKTCLCWQAGPEAKKSNQPIIFEALKYFCIPLCPLWDITPNKKATPIGIAFNIFCCKVLFSKKLL
jgi:hypothetical protein